jgi:hypothetical protein
MLTVICVTTKAVGIIIPKVLVTPPLTVSGKLIRGDGVRSRCVGIGITKKLTALILHYTQD